MIFQIQLPTYCKDNYIFGGKLGIFFGVGGGGGELLPLKYRPWIEPWQYGDVPLAGVAFSSELLERGRTLSGFGGSENSGR